jgi:hypothetical protein
LSPFPYGIKEKPTGWTTKTRLVLRYRVVFLEQFNASSTKNFTKTNLILDGHVASTKERRALGFANKEKLPFETYLDELARSQYIFSPDGDRPECHRHYEAIGFGTVPITQLHPVHFRHFENAVVYNNTYIWTKNKRAELKRQLLLEARKNETTMDYRAMMMEEYWMEYVERTVGTPLRWWDRRAKVPTWLANFALDA